MSKITHPLAALAAGALAMSLATPSTPAAAIPPHAEEAAQLLAVFPDLDHRLVGFLNLTRADYCAWEAAGSPGEPPVLEPTSPAWTHTTGTGQVGGVAVDDLHLELWRMDDDAALVGACEDTDDATAPFAAGTAYVRASDKDPFGTSDGHGVMALGDMTIHAVLDGADGSRYGYHLHVIDMTDPNGVWRQAENAQMTLTELS